LAASFQLALNASPTDPSRALRDTVQRMAQRLSIEPSGSTLSAVYISPDKKVAHVAILGDSPVIIRDSRGEWNLSPLHNARTNLEERTAALAQGARYSEGYL